MSELDAQHEAHVPLLDVVGDQEAAAKEDVGHAPPPPTGESFGVATPVRPPGLSKKMVAIVSVSGLAFLFLLIFGIAFGISSKAGEAHALRMGDLTQKKPFMAAVGGGLAPSEAFATPAPNGTPTPFNPLSRGANPNATPIPGVVPGGLGNKPVCQVQPGYAGPAQPGCPNQTKTAGGTQSGGGNPPPQSTASPAEVAAQRDRDEQVAYVQHEAQATAFVSDTGGSQTGNTTSQLGSVSHGNPPTQQNAPAMQPQAYGATSPTPPPANYLNVGVGTWIPVTTKGWINCAVNGGVTVQVSAWVPDVSGTYPLIAPYATISGRTIPVSNGHCDVVWTLLHLPNGYETTLYSYHSQDAQGEAGIGGMVDDHRWSIARTGLYAAGVAAAAGYVLSKATQQQQAPGSVVIVTQTSPTQQAITAAVGPIQSAADRLINSDASKPSEVKLPDGTHLNVYIDSPIYLPVYQGANHP